MVSKQQQIHSLESEVAYLKGRVSSLSAVAEDAEALGRALWFIQSRGYRPCNIAACNCPYWHGGHAEQRLDDLRQKIAEIADDFQPATESESAQALQEMRAAISALVA